MEDWTDILQSYSRSRTFHGTGPADEDAYYAFFDLPTAQVPRLRRLAGAIDRLRRWLDWRLPSADGERH